MKIKYPRLQYSMVCDDIRLEVGNKLSFMGVYREVIFVADIPHLFPKLCFHLVFDDVKTRDNVTIKFISPDDEELFRMGPAKVELPQDVKSGLCMMDVVLMNLNISKEGLHRLVCVFDDDEKSKQEVKINLKKAV